MRAGNGQRDSAHDQRLGDVTQSDVHTAIAGQDNRFHIVEHPPDLLRVPFSRIVQLGVGEVCCLPDALNLDVSSGNTEFDQEAQRLLRSTRRSESA
jgi:hypothetical protein